MHQYIINASIQIIPIVEDRHPYEWVDEAIGIIQRSGICYDVGPFATVMEGSYDEVMKVIHSVNDHLYERGCTEWITGLQIQFRNNRDIRGEDKTAKYNNAVQAPAETTDATS